MDIGVVEAILIGFLRIVCDVGEDIRLESRQEKSVGNVDLESRLEAYRSTLRPPSDAVRLIA